MKKPKIKEYDLNVLSFHPRKKVRAKKAKRKAKRSKIV